MDLGTVEREEEIERERERERERVSLKTISPFRCRSLPQGMKAYPALKEHLLELPSAANANGPDQGRCAPDDVASLEEMVDRWQLPHVPDEDDDDDERSFRIDARERKDRAATVLGGLLVLVYVGCCAGAMWTNSLSVLELMFVVSFVQGPFLIYQDMQRSLYRCKFRPPPQAELDRQREALTSSLLGFFSAKREWIGKLWSDAKELGRRNDSIRLQMNVLTDKVKR